MTRSSRPSTTPALDAALALLGLQAAERRRARRAQATRSTSTQPSALDEALARIGLGARGTSG